MAFGCIQKNCTSSRDVKSTSFRAYTNFEGVKWVGHRKLHLNTHYHLTLTAHNLFSLCLFSPFPSPSPPFLYFAKRGFPFCIPQCNIVLYCRDHNSYNIIQ